MKKYFTIAALLFAVIITAACGPNPLAPTPTPSAGPLPTPVPPTAAPAGPVADPYISLNYDETNSDPLTPGQKKLIALYLRDAMGQNGTQAAMERAVGLIQQEAAASKATVFEGKTLKLDQRHAWLVWCPNRTSDTDFPTDTSDVFDKLRNGPGMVWIQVPFAQGVPLRSKDAFSNCNGGNGAFWAVAVH